MASSGESTGELLPDEYYPEIGALAANAAILDRKITRTLWALLSLDEDLGRKLTTQLVNGKRKIAFMESLGARYCGTDQKLLAEWTKVCCGLKGAHSYRNKIIHATWSYGTADKRIAIVTWDEDEATPIVELMPLKKLVGYNREITIAERQLTAFLDHVQIASARAPVHRPKKIRR